MRRVVLVVVGVIFALSVFAQEQHSVARKWNEVLLEAIRNDLARPTVHARNLFHVSAAMYDAWAVFEDDAETYFLGHTRGDFMIPFEGFDASASEPQALQEEAMSYAAYRLIQHRFRNSPGFSETSALADSLLGALGYPYFSSTNYQSGSVASLGNYIADQIIRFGFTDGANELADYTNLYYEPLNEPLNLTDGGDNHLTDPNRWQPLQFGETFIDQSGNPIEIGVIDFLSPEWGDVVPFSFGNDDKTLHMRGDDTYQVFMDPGPPPFLDASGTLGLDDPYKWGFALVSVWSAHLDPTDGVTMDISPRAIGNIPFDQLPTDLGDYGAFYDLIDGGDISQGYNINPVTGMPYPEQVVPRADYARVLAEFWADGPDSETPPGHWFTILNYVNDHPMLEKRFMGEGDELSDLEWDIKSYFLLAGTMHDVAIAAWSAKGYYDYIRPISAIRYMATQGQSSDPNLPRFSTSGIPLVEGYIEMIGEGDPLAGDQNENLEEIKVMAWRGHDFIEDADADTAGVGWILAKEWWPYQRPSFVTPPFAGYVSGHSTYSRAAAEVLTRLTGDEYFPGGVGEFVAPQNEFLVFERGPSVDVVLQWAKYYDASDQCSLSRIWGGIHPPADDIPGRLMGAVIGEQAFDYGRRYFDADVLANGLQNLESAQVYPNPTQRTVNFLGVREGSSVRLTDMEGRSLGLWQYRGQPIRLPELTSGVYILQIEEEARRLLILN